MHHFKGLPIVIVSILGLLLFISGFSKNENSRQTKNAQNSTLTDYDGNVYKTVKIGTQIWMAENLKVTHYRDGTSIPNAYDNRKWQAASAGAFCLFNNDSIEYKNTYGLLYNFHAVNNNKNLSPKGWHIPSEDECMQLINHLGGLKTAGRKIKDNSKKLWKSIKTCADDKSDFSGLPAGGRGRLGTAGEVGYYATWWSSTSYDSLYAWHWGLYPDKDGIRCNPGHKASGFSVRCVKD